MAGRLNSVSSHVGRPVSQRIVVPKVIDMAPNMAFASHLKWMRQKYILRQDMFLIGDPGSIRRRLAYQFCRVEGLQPELLTITRDTVEADLRQRREIGKNGETIYVDSAVVRAAIMGRVLILDGIEKAERNVLPTINNLLENREMVLDDGRCLLSHIKYDKLTEDLGQAEVTARNLLRVSPRFIVVALGLPVPPCVGHTLDPPLRSRFQGRVIAGLSAEPQATPSLRDFVDAVVQSPELPLLPGDAMSGLQKAFTVTGDTYEAIARVYPWKLFPAEACRGVNSILASLGISQKSPKLGEAGSHISQETGFVTTPSVRKTIEDIGKDWRAGLDICLVGPAGCGKTQTMLHFIRSLKPSRDIETMFLYRDMSARDLLQRRVTDVATGATIWLPSSAVRAAVEGKVLVLDGLDRVPTDVLCALAPLISDRQCPLQSPDPSGSGLILTGAGNASVSGSETAGPRVIQVHPNFRVVALAAPPTQGNAWLSPEVMSLFSFHILGEASIAEIISAKYSGSAFVPELLSLKQTLDGCQGIPPLTLRRMLRIAKICDSSPSKETLASTAWRQLLLNLVPPLEREALPKGFTRDFAAASSSLQEADGIEISLQDDAVVIDGIRGWMYRPGPDDNRPELIPQVRERFVLIPAHKRFMAEIHRDMFLHGERSLLIVGPQGVGKNMVIDYYMEMLRVERYYMQLHRDSTVGSLTSTPALHEGAIVWKESPLVTAAVEGRWIVLDEADKAPLEVVVLLKSLIEDGYLNLPDGRCLGGSGGTPIHPNFRCIVLCNRPGFPFLGNDFFRECGDIFSVFLMENPDHNSELMLVHSVAPEVPIGVLSRLVSVFGELRRLTTDGVLSYPFSTRELLASARHMNRFGRSDEALQGVLAFERWDRMALANIRKVLERHGFSSKAILDGVSDSAAVLLQEPHLLPKLQRIGSLQKSSLQPTTPPGPWTKVESRTFVMEPSLECPLKSLELPRSVGTFTERAASFKLPLSKYTRADDMVDIVESQGYIHVLSDSVADGMRLYSVDTDKWECTQRSLGISAARWMHTDAPSAEVVVNGRRPRSRNKPQLMVVDQKVLVWNPAAGILVAMPEHNRNRGVVHRLFVSKPDSFIAVAAGDGRSLKLIGTREMYEVDISQDSARLRLLLRSPETLAHITNIASGGSAIVVTAQNGRGMQIDARGASRLAFPVAPVVYDFANSVYQSADPTGAFFYRVEVDGSIWECPGEASRAGFTLSSVVGRSGTILNCRVGELEIVDTVQPASVRHLPLRECAVQCITEMKEGRQLAILYTDGWIDVIEILREQLAVAEKEYRQLRSLPTREDHRTASGQPKHGKEDDAPHVGGNTFAGGTGGADTAGLGGVGGPYRLDKGHPVHQVSDEVKASISPEAAEAARKMGQEALRKRLEEIRMSEADWQRYREIVDGVADEIAQLRRVLHTADSRLRERKWLAGTEGELDENKLVDALAGDKRVYRRRALQEPKVGEPQVLPKHLSIVLDISASMYRFNGVDGRLKRMTEVAVLLMEALHGFEDRFVYEIRGHSGDGPAIGLVDFGNPPRDEKEKYRIVQEICAHAQYCSAGDSTLDALRIATDRLLSTGPADEKLVMAFSDANLDRYGIHPKQLDAVLNRAADQVYAHVFFIASFDDQAEVLCRSIPKGKATVATNLSKLPQLIKEVLAATVNHQK